MTYHHYFLLYKFTVKVYYIISHQILYYIKILYNHILCYIILSNLILCRIPNEDKYLFFYYVIDREDYRESPILGSKPIRNIFEWINNKDMSKSSSISIPRFSLTLFIYY